MAIQIVSVKKQDSDYFSRLDPFERLSMLDIPGAFALAALDYENGEVRAPVGLLTGLVNEHCLILSWIGVDSERQGQGIGEKLLLKAFDIADSNDIEILEELISSKYEMEQIAYSGKRFFEDRLFDVEKPIPMEYEGTIGDLNHLDFFQKDMEALPKPIALSTLSPAEIKQALRQIDAIGGAAKLYPVADAKDQLDWDLSFVYLDEGEAYEGLLIQKVEDYLLPVYFYSESDNESAGLLLHCVKAAAQKYGKDMDVEILSGSELVLSLMQSVFPGKKMEGKKLVARVESYRKERRG